MALNIWSMIFAPPVSRMSLRMSLVFSEGGAGFWAASEEPHNRQIAMRDFIMPPLYREFGNAAQGEHLGIGVLAFQALPVVVDVNELAADVIGALGGEEEG